MLEDASVSDYDYTIRAGVAAGTNLVVIFRRTKSWQISRFPSFPRTVYPTSWRKKNSVGDFAGTSLW